MKNVLLGFALAFGLTMALPAEASDCYGTAPAPAYKKAYPQNYTYGKKVYPNNKSHYQYEKKHHQRGKRQSLRAQIEQLDAAGKLSRKERLILEKNLSDLRTMRQNALYDGVITPAERAKLKAARQKIEHNIALAARY